MIEVFKMTHNNYDPEAGCRPISAVISKVLVL